MRKLMLLTLMLLTLPGTALAAPPANDNRTAAEAIPAFPHTVAATTVEATVERLDPQVSRCGRVESTLWYRIDTAPDGLIALTVKGAAGIAPVVRIYRRNASAIQEVDCASAAAGGSASASVEAVRGSNYLVLVGRKPSTPDGAFELRAELFLPPSNDNRVGAQAIKLPGSARGTTLGATSDEADPTRCGLTGATVWYRLPSRRDGRILLRLTAAGQLDAAIVVLERVRSQTGTVTCGATNRRGQATVAFASERGATYLIAVGHLRNADPGTFRIDALVSEAAESLSAGTALPRGGARSSVHGLTDVNDVWRISMRPGTTYRIGFSGDSSCPSVSLRARRHPEHRLAFLSCRGYTTFTPGPDGAGRYILEVVASGEPSAQGYRLLFAPAAPDDLGVGIELRNRVSAKGSLEPARLDVRDLYHFDVERRGDVRLEVTNGLRFELVRDDGQRLGTYASLRRALDPGRYVVAVTASFGDPGSSYALSLLIREITATTLRLAAATVAPGSPVTLRPEVANATGGTVEIQVDRFDPLTGWHFNRLLRVPAGSSATWAPPAEGRWRFRATYKGTIDASPSRSGYAQLLVKQT
ncbi:MAG TPA: hypothetical protein VM049_01275 [Gaiellaceae bacterium]|nr:hypothetical protein [Gaiellaceae bacterium]